VVHDERRIEVDTHCKAIGELLVEAAGEVSGLSSEQLAHLEGCPSCRALANAERTLSQLLETAVPPEDPAFQERVMISLNPAPLRSRVVALLPVAASLIVAMVGAAMVGGVPGGSLLARLPLWSSRGWLALVGATGDWAVALAATSRAAHVALPPMVLIAAVLLAVLGTSAVVVLTRRWRALSPWRRDA
jgi:hypothetical protein